MKLDLSTDFDLNKFRMYAKKLIEKGSKVELKEIKPRRTLSQNSYAHVVFSLFAIETGYTLQEIKTLMKRDFGCVYEKSGQKFLKSTSDMDTAELSGLIEFTRDKAAKQMIYIPSADEYKAQSFEIDKLIEQHKNYL